MALSLVVLSERAMHLQRASDRAAALGEPERSAELQRQANAARDLWARTERRLEATAGTVQLRRGARVRLVRGQRSTFDRRRRIDWQLYEYFDDEGNEYRKVFETRPGADYTPPAVGTHAQLDRLKRQW